MTAVSPLRVPVLMYHEIADISATQDPFAVSPRVFAEQLAYLREAGFTTLTAGALSAIVAHGEGDLPARPVVLTFDDGYGDFYTQALPLLRQHGFTATVFQTTGWVGKEDEAKRMLNWQELAESEQAGIEIGAHTCTHPQLDQLPEDLLREELYASKSLLEDWTGVPVRLFQRQGQAGGEGARLRVRLRRGQLGDDPRGQPVHPAAAHRAAVHLGG
jgi:peptidoglycan/xylan/chitin deacetylase (PgdA/CDA1 family)